ncbi:hypothetical protein CVT26_005937 [Gymnopilus dilepis]|uniref:Beta-xylanase n=1 Tax=Gymnopilus dilepis TaxID=231916 RepID=A0A409Y1U6_9AGAR|nr:hypothetical protein CVT26_005937 [Gymnopilus dilepis]
MLPKYLLGLLTLLPLATALVTAATGLSTAAKAAGKKYFGSATDNSELTNTAYVAELSNTADFSQLTAENSMKWDATEPNQGQFTFTQGDQILQLAQKNGQLMRGHNCVWHEQLPSWVTNTKWTNATLTAAMTNHISNLMGHYKGKMYSWDVVNEPFNEDGSLFSSVFTQFIGPSYIPIALKAARAADPSTKLYINEFNIEFSGAKATAMMNLVKSLKAQNVPIDGIGLQCHFIVGQVPSNFQSILQQFTALGVEVAITELDIRMTLPATTQLLQQQQTDYQNVISACKNVANCVGVTVWDYTDEASDLSHRCAQFSWIPGAFPGMGEACPFDASLNKKPAYQGILNGWA